MTQAGLVASADVSGTKYLELLPIADGGALTAHDAQVDWNSWHMIEVHMEDELVSRVFATPGYAYEKKIGDELPPPGWRGRPA